MANEKINVHVREIKEQQKYYDFYKKLPKIMFFIILGMFFIWGIHHSSGGWYSSSYYYGIMGVSSGFLCWFIWQLIGLAIGAVTYFISKISISVKIMQTEYLAIVAKEVADEDYEENELSVYSLSNKTVNGWVCPKCGKGNDESTIFCVVCGANKPSKSYSNVDEKEDLRPRWDCKECGYSNNPAAKACANCGKPKI